VKGSQYPYDRNLPDGKRFTEPEPADEKESQETNNQTNKANSGRTADGAKPKTSAAKDKVKKAKSKKVLNS